MVLLLWVAKIGTAKIECSFEMVKKIPLGVTLFLLSIVPLLYDALVTFIGFSTLILDYLFDPCPTASP